MKKQAKILVIGGGIAGLTLANLLHRETDITIIDKSPSWNDLGYLISLWGSGGKILRELGIEDEALRRGYQIPGAVLNDKNGKELKHISFDSLQKYGNITIIPRHDLHNALVKKVAGRVNLRLGLNFTTIKQDEEGVEVTFSNGETERFDLVVGADGIKSKVREMVFGKGHLKPFGMTLWLFWLSAKIPIPKEIISFSVRGRCFFIYPTKKMALATLAATLPPGSPEPTEEKREYLKRLFHDFDPMVLKAIESIEHPKQILRFDIADVHLSKWHKGRVVLLGDAQHATSPITGMGTSMALEDAFSLAEELKHFGFDHISDTLAHYSKKRRGRIRLFRKMGRKIQRKLVCKYPFVSMMKKMVFHLMPNSFFTGPMEKVMKGWF